MTAVTIAYRTNSFLITSSPGMQLNICSITTVQAFLPVFHSVAFMYKHMIILVYQLAAYPTGTVAILTFVRTCISALHTNTVFPGMLTIIAFRITNTAYPPMIAAVVSFFPLMRRSVHFLAAIHTICPVLLIIIRIVPPTG